MQHRKLMFSALIAAVATAAGADAQRIGPAFVFDGDTVAIGGQRARIWGIEAPDVPLAMKKAAGDYLAATIRAEGGISCAFADRDNAAMRQARAPACPSGFTSHERTVTSCRFRRSGSDVGERMVRAGYAVDWRGFSGGYYFAQQRQARAEGSGLWTSWQRPMAQLASLRGRQRKGCAPSPARRALR